MIHVILGVIDGVNYINHVSDKIHKIKAGNEYIPEKFTKYRIVLKASVISLSLNYNKLKITSYMFLFPP